MKLPVKSLAIYSTIYRVCINGLNVIYIYIKKLITIRFQLVSQQFSAINVSH